MCGKAARIQLTEQMHQILQHLAASQNVSDPFGARAKVILLAFQKLDNGTIAQKVGLCRRSVGVWRRRWRDSFEALLQMQFTESDAAFERAILGCLSDAPRSGSPGKFTPEQIAGLIRIACEPPENSSRPLTTWSDKELADEAQKRGLVDSISASHVNQPLRNVDRQPYRSSANREFDPEPGENSGRLNNVAPNAPCWA